MSNNWKTPKSEKWLQWEELIKRHGRKLRAEWPDLSDDEVANKVLAMPEVKALGNELDKEFIMRLTEDVIDEDCFVYSANGKKLIIEDKKLLRMSDRKLAAWAQKTGVMFAQLKAHLAERFPVTEGSA